MVDEASREGSRVVATCSKTAIVYTGQSTAGAHHCLRRTGGGDAMLGKQLSQGDLPHDLPLGTAQDRDTGKANRGVELEDGGQPPADLSHSRDDKAVASYVDANRTGAESVQSTPEVRLAPLKYIDVYVQGIKQPLKA